MDSGEYNEIVNGEFSGFESISLTSLSVDNNDNNDFIML